MWRLATCYDKFAAANLTSRLATLARERGPTWTQEQLTAQEAEFQRAADWRKQQAEVNLPRWAAIRGARGQGKMMMTIATAICAIPILRPFR